MQVSCYLCFSFYFIANIRNSFVILDAITIKKGNHCCRINHCFEVNLLLPAFEAFFQKPHRIIEKIFTLFSAKNWP